MKNVLLSADNEISVFSVPNEVADNLQQYCLGDEQSRLITTFVDVYDKNILPQEYVRLPYFNF